MDSYTMQEEAWKRGFERGRENTIVWHEGRDIPPGTERALIQKVGGRVFYLERKGIEMALECWTDVVAWAEVVPMREV